MKVRVYDSDGVYRGGLFKTDVFTASNCRVWHAPPHPHYHEKLIDIAGLRNRCRAKSWYILQLSTTPDLSGPPDGSDSFDHNSRAIRTTPLGAKDWLIRHGYPPPPDLLRLLSKIEGLCAARTGHGARAPTGRATVDAAGAEDPLTEAQQAVWDALRDGRPRTGKELAALLQLGAGGEDAVRKRIAEIRRSGRAVENRRGAGYYRPDAAPHAEGPPVR